MQSNASMLEAMVECRCKLLLVYPLIKLGYNKIAIHRERDMKSPQYPPVSGIQFVKFIF